jgi:carboxyl-terminal processing protease
MACSIFQLRTRRWLSAGAFLLASASCARAAGMGVGFATTSIPTSSPVPTSAPAPKTTLELAQETVDETTALLAKDPKNLKTLYRRGAAFLALRRFDEAARDGNKMLEAQPNNGFARLLLANAYLDKKAYAEAFANVDQAELVGANRATVLELRGKLLSRTGEYERAVAEMEQALRFAPNNVSLKNALAWTLAVSPDEKARDGKKAAEIAKGLAGPGSKRSAYIDTLAAVDAENGDFDLAIKEQREAMVGLEPAKKADYQQRLDLYLAHKPYRLAPLDQAAIEWDRKRNACFEVVWTTVDQEYFETNLGVDWGQMRDRYRLPLSNARNDDELRALLQSMLNELHRTHFAIVPRSSAVFTPEERVRQGTVGARLAYVDEQVVVASVQKNSAAEKADLRTGDALISLNGVTLASVKKALEPSGLSATRIGLYLKDSLEAQLDGKVGTELKFVVQDVDKKERDIALKIAPFEGVWSEPVGNFPSTPIDLETVRHDDGIAYARFNTFALPVVKPLKTFFRSLRADDGLIIDLRGNPGGALIMAPGLSGWLSKQEYSMGTVRLRDSSINLDVYPQSRAFTGPIAVLIDGSSASTSEVFAGGLRELKRARIFGQTSAGAALPSSYKRLPNDDLFQYAIGDIRTPSGRLLEGDGVQPDQLVQTTREQYAAHDDPVIAAAVAWLNEARKTGQAAEVRVSGAASTSKPMAPK